MARPRKATVDYFPHSCVTGKTLFILQGKFKNDGYAFWFKLLELLGTTEGHYYDYNKPEDWQFLLGKTLVSDDTAKVILQTLADLDAVDQELYEKKIIWVQKFVNNLADVYKRRQVSLPLKPNSDNSNIPQPSINTDDILDPELAEVIKFYEDNCSGSLTGPVRDEICDMLDHYPDGYPLKAMQIAAKNHKFIMPYIRAILVSSEKEGIPPGERKDTQKARDYDFS